MNININSNVWPTIIYEKTYVAQADTNYVHQNTFNSVVKSRDDLFSKIRLYDIVYARARIRYYKFFSDTPVRTTKVQNLKLLMAITC